MKISEIITDGPVPNKNKYQVTYTTNRGRDENTRTIYANSKKEAVLFVLKRLGTPTEIDGGPVNLSDLDALK